MLFCPGANNSHMTGTRPLSQKDTSVIRRAFYTPYPAPGGSGTWPSCLEMQSCGEALWLPGGGLTLKVPGPEEG